MKILKTVLIYMLCIFIILIVFVISCHYITLNKHPEDIQILQAETPDFDKIQALLTQNQPTVFRQVLYGWDPIVHIFDASISDIDYLIQNNPDFNTDILNCLSSIVYIMSLGWEYTIMKEINQ